MSDEELEGRSDFASIFPSPCMKFEATESPGSLDVVVSSDGRSSTPPVCYADPRSSCDAVILYTASDSTTKAFVLIEVGSAGPVSLSHMNLLVPHILSCP